MSAACLAVEEDGAALPVAPLDRVRVLRVAHLHEHLHHAPQGLPAWCCRRVLEGDDLPGRCHVSIHGCYPAKCCRGGDAASAKKKERHDGTQSVAKDKDTTCHHTHSTTRSPHPDPEV